MKCFEFKPKADMTACELAIILVRLAQLPEKVHVAEEKLSEPAWTAVERHYEQLNEPHPAETPEIERPEGFDQ